MSDQTKHDRQPVNQQPLAALKEIARITGDAGFNVGGPLQNATGNESAATAMEFLRLAANYLEEISKVSAAAIAAAEVAQPVVLQQTVSVTDERTAFEAWLQEGIDGTDTVRPSDDKVEAYFATWLAHSQQPSTAQPVAVPDWLLSADDMKNLRRFAECCEDFESGGHDVPNAAMKRLELAGAVRSCGFGRHEATAFGNAVLSASQKGGAA